MSSSENDPEAASAAFRPRAPAQAKDQTDRELIALLQTQCA